MIDIADKIYAATGLTLGAEAAAKIGQMIQAENEKLRAALRDIARQPEGDEESAQAVARAALGQKE
jgi:hypothetical protein